MVYFTFFAVLVKYTDATLFSSWMPNIDLRPLHIDEVKDEVQGKKSKQLWGAYQVAAEGNDLQHYKDLLAQHEEDMREEAAAAEAAAEEKAAKVAKKGSKKSKATTEDEDTVMDDEEPVVEEEAEEGGKKAKASKKRKKDAESEGEGAKVGGESFPYACRTLISYSP